MKVELSAEAAEQVFEIDTWWRENRPAAVDLFATEMAGAISDLGATPTLGSRYEARPGVRRLLLRRTHFHVYFVERDQRIRVFAVWNAYRGRGPAW